MEWTEAVKYYMFTSFVMLFCPPPFGVIATAFHRLCHYKSLFAAPGSYLVMAKNDSYFVLYAVSPLIIQIL